LLDPPAVSGVRCAAPHGALGVEEVAVEPDVGVVEAVCASPGVGNASQCFGSGSGTV
jgi:hypothetical protein